MEVNIHLFLTMAIMPAECSNVLAANEGRITVSERCDVQKPACVGNVASVTRVCNFAELSEGGN